MFRYIFQSILILAFINVCHMGWIYFNKLGNFKKKVTIETNKLQKINTTIDEEMDKTEIPQIEFCQMESDLEEFMKSMMP